MFLHYFPSYKHILNQTKSTQFCRCSTGSKPKLISKMSDFLRPVTSLGNATDTIIIDLVSYIDAYIIHTNMSVCINYRTRTM